LESLGELVSKEEIKGIADYPRIAKKMEGKVDYEKAPANRRIKIAIQSNFTVGGMKDALLVKCLREDIYPEIYVGGYDQYNQEILNPSSEYYSFKPNLTILILDTRTIFGEAFLQPYSESESERRQRVESFVKGIASLVEKIKQNSKSKVIINNFEIPTHSPLGIIEDKQIYGFKESVEDLNSKLREAFRGDTRVFLFDYEAFASNVGKDNTTDDKMYYLGDFRISPAVIPALCDAYIPYVRALLSMMKKCLVLDLDNVLWGGVVGEDGIEGIKLGPTPEGRPYLELQKYILSLYNRGVILAINSANNLDDALEVLRKHPYMVLKEDYFAAMKINWDNKISNMKAIAEELEIGIDSLVFLDDSKANRQMMREALPEVSIVDLPDDPALYLRTVANLRVFDSLQLTAEDRARGKMYADQRKRVEFEKTATDIDGYLKGLGTVVTLEIANKFNIPRISQLTQKTNQFNTTTRRYLEDEIARMASSDHYLVAAVKVEDKFGDSGTTGVAIVEKDSGKWKIDSFLLSCRVIGRGVEDALLAYIIAEARRAGAKAIVGEFIPTKKNLPAKDFFKNRNFKQLSVDNGVETWEYDLQAAYAPPEFVKLVVK
jgi:FkbH-like protein